MVVKKMQVKLHWFEETRGLELLASSNNTLKFYVFGWLTFQVADLRTIPQNYEMRW